KLGAMCLGGCRVGIAEAARYAATRRQFGHAIAAFGAIRHKLGEMPARGYALESLVYRVAGLIDERHATSPAEGLPAILEEFAIEASIAKVGGSETLEYVVDDTCERRQCRARAAPAPSATTPPSAITATRASIESSKERTKSTGC